MSDTDTPMLIHTCPPGTCKVMGYNDCTCLAVPVAEYDALKRELAQAQKGSIKMWGMLASIREAMIIQGVNQRITDWKPMIAAIDAAMKEQK